MKKRYLYVLALASATFLAACGGGTQSSSTPVSSTPESSAPASSTPASTAPVATKLAAPVLTLNEAKTGLTWAAVEHAAKYQLKVGDDAYADATDYTFSTTVGTYAVSVKAIGDGTTYLDSDAATWSYETKEISLSDLTQDGMSVSWTAVGATVATGFSATGTIADTDWAAVTGSSYTATSNGKLGVVVSGGYDVTGNINYVGEKITKYTWVIAKATADKVLLDETTDLVDGVTSQVYESTGWAAAGAHSVLSAVYPDTEEKEKSVDFKIQQLSNAYKYGFAVSGLDAYSGISTMVRGDGKSTLVFQIEGAWGYASYSVGVLNSNWHAITIPFADNGWKVNGGAQSLNDFALSQDFLGAGYALYGVTSFDIVWKTIGDSGYAFTDVYMKNAVLASDWTLANKDTASYSLGTTYTSLVNKVDLKLVQGENNVFTLSSLNLKANLNAALTLSKDGENLTFKTADDGASLTYVGKVDDKGRKIAFVSASGTYGAYLQQADFNIVTTIDDFESYTATGTGYDGNNTDLSKVSGLRAAYYGEYYTGSGSGTSALGDKNWQMMGSTDYANLVTTSAHGGNNSVSFKRSTNAMRFTTSGMALKTALPWAKADTFSFWAKGVSADVTLKVQMFDSANALYWLTPTTFTIPANSDWTQYTVALTATKSYYGFGFLFANASPVVYPQIDDIQLFTSGNPWATYVDSSVVPAGTIMTGSTTALKSVTATFGSDSTLTVAAIDAADATHNLTGTYSVDASNVITIDCGTDLNYVGVLSNDKTAIKYTSATGTLATYVASLFLEATVTGKTRVAGYENTTSSALQTLYTVEETDSFTAVTDKTSYIQEDETVLDSGFASAKLKADVTSGNYNGKYRYRFAVAASYGSVSNIAIRLKNAGSYAITGGVFYVNTASDSTKRTNAGVSFTIAAGAGWTTYTGTFTAHDVYGFSIYFSSVGTSLAAATGSLYIDNVFVW